MVERNTYLVCINQDGYGCDYSIGCGQLFYEVFASSMEDAKAEVFKKFTIDENEDSDIKDWIDVIEYNVEYVFDDLISRNKISDRDIHLYFSESYIGIINDLRICCIETADYYAVNPKDSVYPSMISKLKDKLNGFDKERIEFERLKAKFEPNNVGVDFAKEGEDKTVFTTAESVKNFHSKAINAVEFDENGDFKIKK